MIALPIWAFCMLFILAFVGSFLLGLMIFGMKLSCNNKDKEK